MTTMKGMRFDERGLIAAVSVSMALAGCGKSAAPTGGGGDIAKIAAEKGIERVNLKLGR